LFKPLVQFLFESNKCLGLSALIGGETAEMPGMYGDDYDLVGSITGIVEHDRIVTGAKICHGHVVIGLASNGLHTNGYSLARHVLFDTNGVAVDSRLPELGGQSVGEALLAPHTCYWSAIRPALADDAVSLDGMAHITGGGLYDNIPRVLPAGVDVVIDPTPLAVPPIFKLIGAKGDIAATEMYRVFNMGIGMVWLVPKASAESALEHCRSAGLTAAVIGEATAGTQRVTIEGVG